MKKLLFVLLIASFEIFGQGTINGLEIPRASEFKESIAYQYDTLTSSFSQVPYEKLIQTDTSLIYYQWNSTASSWGIYLEELKHSNVTTTGTDTTITYFEPGSISGSYFNTEIDIYFYNNKGTLNNDSIYNWIIGKWQFGNLAIMVFTII